MECVIIITQKGFILSTFAIVMLVILAMDVKFLAAQTIVISMESVWTMILVHVSAGTRAKIVKLTAVVTTMVCARQIPIVAFATEDTHL